MTTPFDAISLPDLYARRSSKWRTFGDDVLAAWVAEMDFAPAEPIRRVLTEMVARHDFGYPSLTDQPLQALRTLFCDRMQRQYAWHIPTERVEVLVDVMQGAQIAMMTLSDEGDGVITQTPVYPCFLQDIHDARRRLVLNPLVQDHRGDYHMDTDQLRACIDPRTKLVLFCNPHNPSGRVFTKQELEAVAAIAIERDLIILSDEIHADLIYPGHTHIPIASLGPEIAARTITFTSATKAFNIPGLRCAVAVFGSETLQDQFNRIPHAVRGGVSSLGLYATMAAWKDGDAWLQELRAYLDINRRRVAEFAREYMSAGLHPTQQATYLAWLDCRHLNVAEQTVGKFFLAHAKVALNEGEAFGPQGRGFVRLNFATSHAILDSILQRMADALSTRVRPDSKR